MQHLSLTVINAMQLGPDSPERTVLFVTKLLTAMVAGTSIGLLLGICIRSILKVLWSGTEYGTWPGLKKWIGRKSILSGPKKQTFTIEDALKIHEEALNEISGVSPLSKGQIGNFDGMKIVVDSLAPKNTMYVLNPSHMLMVPLSVLYSSPKLRKYPTGRRTPEHDKITALLREYLEPIHMEGGETWLEVKNPQFDYDMFADRVIQVLEEE